MAHFQHASHCCPQQFQGCEGGIIMNIPLWSVLSCHFPAEIRVFSGEGTQLEKCWWGCGTAWDRAACQAGELPPPIPRDTGTRSRCLSYYLSQVHLSLEDPFKTPMHSTTPSAPSTAAADSLLLSFLLIFLQTALISPVLTSPHWISPISLHPNPASLLPSLLCLLQLLLASPPASLHPCVLVQGEADWVQCSSQSRPCAMEMLRWLHTNG